MLATFAPLILQLSAAVTTPVTFKQDAENWPITVGAVGSVQAFRSSISIDLTEVSISAKQENDATRSYKSYRICLAYKPSQAAWDMAGCSNPVLIRASLKPGESITLPPQHLQVSTSGYPTLKGFWLVLEMNSAPIRGKTYNIYSHSDRTIFDGGQ